MGRYGPAVVGCYRAGRMAQRLSAPDRRRQLLGVALDQFAATGYHATSMDDVAEAAGVTKPVLYQHFGSKRKLYLELLEDVGAELMAAITEATATAAGPRAQVEAGFSAYLAFVGRRRAAFSLLFGSGARRDEEFADAVRRVESSIANAIAALIDVDVDDAHRHTVAHALVGMAEGAVRHAIANGRPLDPERMARQLADLSWAGLRGVRRV
jgi:AcrR family transcriptional regulator